MLKVARPDMQVLQGNPANGSRDINATGNYGHPSSPVDHGRMATEDRPPPAPADAPGPTAAEAAAKRVRGRPFQPGNPGGRRPRSDAVLLKNLRRLTSGAWKVIGTIMLNPRAPSAERLKAAMYLIDRRLGKPTVAISGIDGTPLLGAPANATDDPLAKLFAAIAAARAPGTTNGSAGLSGATPSENVDSSAPEPPPGGVDGDAERPS